MKTLLVQNGDIQLDQGGKLRFVQGSQKLIQDLTLWLQENFGIGYTTPNFGSLLPDMIGSAIIDSSVSDIQNEVQRVISLYQTQQLLDLQIAQTQAQLSNWNKSEIINQIGSISAYQYYDSVIVDVSLVTLANTVIGINVQIDNNGIQVKNG